MLELQLDAERGRALMQQPQQGRARAAAKAVAADPMHAAFEMDRDIVPIGEILRDRAIAFRIGGLEGLQRLVGKHDAEAERVVGAGCARTR